MKNLLLVLSVVAVVSSCGKQNNVNSGDTAGNNGLVASNVVNFEGNYDIVKMSSYDCGASLTIVKECNGYIVRNNVSRNAEDFCNVNKGEQRLGSNDRNPPPPDRIPPSPDGVVVTQQANELKSVVRVGNMAFTNTLTLESNGQLRKISNLKSRNIQCIFQKR